MSKFMQLLGRIFGSSTGKEVELCRAQRELEASIVQLSREKEKLEEILARDRIDQHRIISAMEKHYRRTQHINDMAEQALDIAKLGRIAADK